MSIRNNYERILQNISLACQRAKRAPSGVQVLAVCKGQNGDSIREAVKAGIRLFGENRLLEAEVHMPLLARSDIEWHFIGRLQKNKINRILQDFALIESVDGVKNLEHIQKRVSRKVPVFLEVNIGEEKSKSGFTAEGLRKALPYISHLDNVVITGLMAIPPNTESAEAARPYFTSLRRLRDEIADLHLPNIDLCHLSMGMSQDYEVAVEEGATIVRIGTALFGKRSG